MFTYSIVLHASFENRDMREYMFGVNKITFRCKDARIWSIRLTSLKSIASLLTFGSRDISFSESTASEITKINRTDEHVANNDTKEAAKG